MKKGLKMYKYTVVLFVVLIICVFGTNVLFYAYNRNQAYSYAVSQIEQSGAYLIRQLESQITHLQESARDLFVRPELKTIELQKRDEKPWEYYPAVNDMLYKMNDSVSSQEFIAESNLVIKSQNVLLSTRRGMDHWEESTLRQAVQSLDTVTRFHLQRIGDKLFLFDFPQIFMRTARLSQLDTVLCFEIEPQALLGYIVRLLNSDVVFVELAGGGAPTLQSRQQQPPKTTSYAVEYELPGIGQQLKLEFAIPVYGSGFAVLSTIICVCFLITMVGSAFYLMRLNDMVHKPIRKIIKAFKGVETGCYNVQLSGDETEEFSYLYEAIGNIMEKLKKSMQAEYEQRIALQKSEIKQYQLQINPHFLYNGFYNIQRMCSNKQYDKVVILSKKLASYYRYITRNGIYFVPLAEELKHMQDYIDIQSIRFQDRIAVYHDYDPQSLPDLQVPRLIFQPIIENIYEHAFDAISSDNKITIQMQADPSHLYCRIEDCGGGMPEETMAQLNEWLKTDTGYVECTGILNVNKRLKLHYGPNSGITYSNRENGVGVRTEINIYFKGKGAGPYV